MDRLDAMLVFTRVVERQSFVRAAEDLALPASTVTDAIKKLERRIGVRLLERTTRQVRVTLDGDAYYRRCVDILGDIEDAESAFSAAEPGGLLRANVLGSQAREMILPHLPAFLDRYPQIDLHLSEADRFVDPVREGFDCVIRAGASQESDLVGRQIALLREATIASAGYVQRFGMPKRWDKLDGHRMVGFHSSRLGAVMPLEFQVDGELRTVTLPTRLVVSGTESLLAAALEGIGIIQVPRYSIRAHIERGALVEMLAQTPPSPTPIHVLYPPNRHLSLRVRVFIDWIVELYRKLEQG
ncbi:LysR family transcriptional regulator [Aliihoeflea sp. PC F10.4]